MISPIQLGNSIKYVAEFYNFDEKVEEPDNGTIKFKATLQGSSSPEVLENLSSVNKISKGKYWFIFSPQSIGTYVIEFSAQIAGIVFLKRRQIKVVQV